MRKDTLTIDKLISILFLLVRYRNYEFNQISKLIQDIESKSEAVAAQFRKMTDYGAPYYVGTIVEIISKPDLTDEELSLLDEFDSRRTVYYRVKTNIETYITCDKVKLFDVGTQILYSTDSKGNSLFKFALKPKYIAAGVSESCLFKLSYHLIQLSDIRKFIATTLRLILIFVNNPDLESINIDISYDGDVKYISDKNTATIPAKSYGFIIWVELFHLPPDNFKTEVIDSLLKNTNVSLSRIWLIIDKQFLDYDALRRRRD